MTKSSIFVKTDKDSENACVILIMNVKAGWNIYKDKWLLTTYLVQKFFLES